MARIPSELLQPLPKLGIKKARNPHAASNVNDKDERQHRFTPRKLIEQLHAEFGFTMDACGHPLSPASQIIGAGFTFVKPSKFLTYGNCYAQHWNGESVFLQPDFTKVDEAVEEAAYQMLDGWPRQVVLLGPWNRQEQPYWHRFIEPFRDGRGDLHAGIKLSTRAIKGRVKFGTPSDPEGVKKHPKLNKTGCPERDGDGNLIMMSNAPGFGCGLVIWQRT